MAGRASQVNGFTVVKVKKLEPVDPAKRASKYSELKARILATNGGGYLKIECGTRKAMLRLYNTLRASKGAFNVSRRGTALYAKPGR